MGKGGVDLSEIRAKVRQEQYEISFHAEKERYAENITIAQIEEVILNGEILESYPDDPRGPSCLILGETAAGPVHIVCGYSSSGWIRIITVYLPKPPKWLDQKTRAKG